MNQETTLAYRHFIHVKCLNMLLDILIWLLQGKETLAELNSTSRS
jgi:hypothetical protein